MSITTFGRVHQSNMEEMDKETKLSDITEKLVKNEKDISDHFDEFLKKKQNDAKRDEAIWNKFSELEKTNEEYNKKNFDEFQYDLSKLNTKIFNVEQNLDELHERYVQINSKTIKEIYNQIDLNFTKCHEEIKKVSSEILKQMKDSLNELLKKIESNKIQIDFQQNIENKIAAKMLDMETVFDDLIKKVHENGKRMGLRTYASMDEAIKAEPNANLFNRDPISNLFRIIGYSKNNEDKKNE